MHPVTVFPTRRPADWRGPALLAAAGIAAAVLLVLRRQALAPQAGPHAGPRTSRLMRLPTPSGWRARRLALRA